VHPSFDGDLLPVLAKIRSLYPGFTAGNIEKIRALVSDGFPGMPRFDLTVGGAVRVQELSISNSEGFPELKLLTLSPTAGKGPWPAIYHTHRGWNDRGHCCERY
jgi:hypothetical protein